MTASRQAQAGFTLIELLVALTLVGVMSVAMFGGLRFGTRTWEVGTERSAQLNEVILVQGLLRRHLSQLVAPDLVRQRSELNPLFVGEPRAVRFVAPLSAHVGVGGLYRFELEIEGADQDGQQLVIRWQIYRADGPSAEWDEARVLIEGLDDGGFSYYGAPQPGDDPVWSESWVNQTIMPYMIAIDLEFPDQDQRNWPYFRVGFQRVEGPRP